MKTVVMGLDISPICTGIAVYPSQPGSWSSLENRPSMSLIERATALRGVINQTVEIHKVDICFVEDYAYGLIGPKSVSITQKAELTGIIKYFLRSDYQIRCLPVAPTTLKKWITGTGKGKKELMALHVFKRFNLELGKDFKNDDEMDAFGIAHFGYHVIQTVLGHKPTITKEQDKQIQNYIKVHKEELKV